MDDRLVQFRFVSVASFFPFLFFATCVLLVFLHAGSTVNKEELRRRNWSLSKSE